MPRRYAILGVALGLALALGGVLGAGCYDVPQPACGFRCGAAGECPEDYTCSAADGRCHLNGSEPAACGPIDGGVDAPADAADDAPLDAPGDAALDAAPDAPLDAAPDAIRPLSEDTSKLYFDVIAAAHPQIIRIILEEHVKGYEYQSEIVRTWLAQGRQEGREEGREEGRRLGREAGLAEAAIRLARGKLAGFTEDDEARVRAVHDLVRLEELVLAIGLARNEAEVRGALDHLS